MKVKVAILALATASCGAGEQVNDVTPEPTPVESQAEPSADRFQVWLNSCPQISSYRVTPLVAPVGEDIALSVKAFDPDGDLLVYAWSASDPNLSPGAGSEASYHCGSAGYHIVTLKVSDARCQRSLSLLLLCTEEG